MRDVQGHTASLSHKAWSVISITWFPISYFSHYALLKMRGQKWILWMFQKGHDSVNFMVLKSSISLTAKLSREADIIRAAFILESVNCGHKCISEQIQIESTPCTMQPLSKITQYNCNVTRTFHGLLEIPEF